MQMVERIKKICKQKGTNISNLEKELGFGNGNIRRWDERVPSVERVYILAKRLSVSVDYLLTGKEASELSEEEQKLVELYRLADDRGKKNIIRTAEAERMEQESSASKIG